MNPRAFARLLWAVGLAVNSQRVLPNLVIIPVNWPPLRAL